MSDGDDVSLCPWVTRVLWPAAMGWAEDVRVPDDVGVNHNQDRDSHNQDTPSPSSSETILSLDDTIMTRAECRRKTMSLSLYACRVEVVTKTWMKEWKGNCCSYHKKKTCCEQNIKAGKTNIEHCLCVILMRVARKCDVCRLDKKLYYKTIMLNFYF